MPAILKGAIPEWALPLASWPGDLDYEAPVAAASVLALPVPELPALQLGNTRTQRDINAIITWLQQWEGPTGGTIVERPIIQGPYVIRDEGLGLPRRSNLDFVG